MQHAKFILLIKVGFHQCPRSLRFEPFEKVVLDISVETMLSDEVPERRFDKLDRAFAALV